VSTIFCDGSDECQNFRYRFESVFEFNGWFFALMKAETQIGFTLFENRAATQVFVKSMKFRERFVGCHD